MQTDSTIIDKISGWIKQKGLEKIALYAVILYFVVTRSFSFVDTKLREHYTEELQTQHTDELLMFDEQLSELETKLQERATVQKSEVYTATAKHQKAKKNLSETDKKIQLYENKGLVITENTVPDAISSMDSIRAKLKAEREERKRKLSRKPL